jgi:undecaprenyl diphosphate synthase
MADAVAALVALEPKPERREGRVFRLRGNIRRAFESALTRAGIPKGTDPATRVSFHTLRHTAGSWLTIRGLLRISGPISIGWPGWCRPLRNLSPRHTLWHNCPSATPKCPSHKRRPGDPIILSETELFDAVRAQPVPEHVAIIMDGNGRWATRRGLPRVAGHHEGVKAARSIVRAATGLGLRYLTLYAFSTENWSRPADEVSMLMSLLERSVNAELPELMARNARLRVLGRSDGLPSGVRRGIEHVVHETRNNTGLTVLMAFNYGSRDELLDAVRTLARQVAAGELKPEDISEKKISESLYTADLPDPDLLIRTSGEMRISNFLLWQIAYTELWVTPTLWPDFAPVDLYRAVAEFQGRTRRFGKV